MTFAFNANVKNFSFVSPAVDQTDLIKVYGVTDTHQTTVLNGHTYELYIQGNIAQMLIDQSINRTAVI